MNNLENKNIKDLEAFKNLTDEEKALALQILGQMASTGESEILDDLKFSDFEEIPVDIDTFLDDDRYLGKGLWAIDQVTGERRCTLFPYWRETLHKLFPDNLTTNYNTLILTGSIGLGKTQMAVLAMLYLLYRMLCLKDPYGYYGMMPIDKITFSLLNITIDTAKGVAWDKLQQLLQSSEWFMAHGSLNASRVAPTWQPEKHIELIFGSSNNHVIGRALFCNMSDEVNFTAGNLKNIETQKKKLRKMIAQIDARMVSRFGKGTFLPTLNIVISSKDTEQSFLDDYIKRKEHDNKTLIIDEPQWTVRPDKGTPNDPGAFYVAVGGKMLAHELLPVDASEELVSSYRDKGYQMIKIPPIFRRDFETNLDQALMDIAGISSISAAKFLSGVRLKEAKTASYENPFTKDIIEVGDAPDDLLQYANFFDLSKVKPEDKSKPLFIHLDMSTGSRGKGDKTGIAGVWITGKTPTIPGQEDSLSLHYKLAFSVSIKAPKGYNISFIKNQNFIKWLREQGFAVKVVSADTFQSAAVLQELTLAGFKTQIQSVDRVNSDKICEPYYYLKSAIYDRRVDIYDKCDLLTEELTNLEREASGKIEHPEGGKYGCFVGSTKVSLVDGREVSMTELVSEYEAGKINYVYSFNNKTKCIEPKPILKAWCTQQNASLIEVELDSGKVLTCTPSHRFMMRDGSYKEAQDLQVNDSLMPLYRKYPSTKAISKYRMYYEPIEDKWHYEHRQFAYEILDEKYLVHHKNCNPSDNTPTNLVWCSKAKHIELHKIMSTGSCSDEAKAKRNASLRLWYSDPANEGILNHKVKSVRNINRREDVYDLTVQDNHNFALSCGVFVHNSKDQADAFCGALFDASKFAEEYAYNYGESLTLALDSNFEELATSKEELRKQLTVSFQEEIAKLYMEKAHCDEIAAKQKQEEIQRLNEIKDGIIVL